jgi:hypothetical protein
MKLVMLMYLEEDEACVNRLLADVGVPMVSHLGVEGRGVAEANSGGGWYGGTAPYQSRITLAIVDETMAVQVLDAVRDCEGIQDPTHPIRALQLAVERTAACACETREW